MEVLNDVLARFDECWVIVISGITEQGNWENLYYDGVNMVKFIFFLACKNINFGGSIIYDGIVLKSFSFIHRILYEGKNKVDIFQGIVKHSY